MKIPHIIKNVNMIPIKPAINHTKMAFPKPVSCRELIITQQSMHPMIGIQPINAIISAVTNISPKSVLSALNRLKAIFNNIVLIINPKTMTKTINTTHPRISNPKIQSKGRVGMVGIGVEGS